MSSSATPRPVAPLLALRPTLPDVPAATGGAPPDVAAFQHQVLRPLLKLQNALLLATVADFARDYRVPLATAAPPDQLRLLDELLTRNTRLRYTVVGLVTALLTDDEFAFYRQHRNEINRRLLELARQRVASQIGDLATW